MENIVIVSIEWIRLEDEKCFFPKYFPVNLIDVRICGVAPNFYRNQIKIFRTGKQNH